MSRSLDWLDGEVDAWSRQGLARTLRVRGRAAPGRFERDGRLLLNFGSNDYLGLAADPRLAEAARQAAERYGWGAGASPLVSGWTEAHQQLADDLAAFEQVEAVLLFPTGFAANLGTIAALVGKEDVVYSDRLNHACLIDGARLSEATLRVYPHGDAGRLAEVLARDAGRFRRSLIVTDGVFSMDGTVAPLADLVGLAGRFGAMLLADEAHGTGVFGPDGRGASSHTGVPERVPIKVGTLSKALGSLGGFVAGSGTLVKYLTNHARTQMFSTALPPAAAAAASAALRIVREEPWRREHVFSMADRLRTTLRDAGLSVPDSSGPIVPVIVGEAGPALALAAGLESAGFYVPGIRPPTVPRGTSRLRISVSAAHTEVDIEALGVAVVAAYRSISK